MWIGHFLTRLNVVGTQCACWHVRFTNWFVIFSVFFVFTFYFILQQMSNSMTCGVGRGGGGGGFKHDLNHNPIQNSIWIIFKLVTDQRPLAFVFLYQPMKCIKQNNILLINFISDFFFFFSFSFRLKRKENEQMWTFFHLFFAHAALICHWLVRLEIVGFLH